MEGCLNLGRGLQLGWGVANEALGPLEGAAGSGTSTCEK